MANEKAPKTCILIYGGHIEFGWHLQFIARARYKAQGFAQVIVHCEEPFKYLYQDFAHEIYTYPVKTGRRDRWLYNKSEPSYSKDVAGIHAILRAKYGEIKLFHPNESRCKRPESKWFKYGNPGLTQQRMVGDGIVGTEETFEKYDILLHARNLPKVWYDRKWVSGSRNWPAEKWKELCGSRTMGVASVGTESGAIHVPNTIDLRGIPIEALCGFMAKAKVVVGPSSGPMHLAMLCGCPAVVWTHRIKEKSLDRHTNRWRYEKAWNPLNTPVTVIDKHNWNPPVEAVLEAIGKYL